eukprot:15299586-Alexandrium_andersonii.AAC.1
MRQPRSKRSHGSARRTAQRAHMSSTISAACAKSCAAALTVVSASHAARQARGATHRLRQQRL